MLSVTANSGGFVDCGKIFSAARTCICEADVVCSSDGLFLALGRTHVWTWAEALAESDVAW